MRYILYFILAATGYDASQDTTTQPPTSQLAIQMEALPFNSVLTQWATNQFAGLWRIAQVYDAKHNHMNNNKNRNNNVLQTDTNNTANRAAPTAATTNIPGTMPETPHPPGTQPAAQQPGMPPINQTWGTTPAALQCGGNTRVLDPGTTPNHLANYTAATYHYQITHTLDRLTVGTGVPREQINPIRNRPLAKLITPWVCKHCQQLHHP